MWGHLGVRTWHCRECGARLQLPYDWTRPMHRQPRHLTPWRWRMIEAHARQAPQRHAAVLLRYHLSTRRLA